MPLKPAYKRLRILVQGQFLAALLPAGGCDPPKPMPEALGELHFVIPKVEGADEPLPLPDLTPIKPPSQPGV